MKPNLLKTRGKESRICCCRPLFSAVCVLLGAPTLGAELSGYAVLTSDYVFRGTTFSDGHLAAQIGVDWSFDNGLYMGAWASSVDIEVADIADRDLEIDYYLGYVHELGDVWTLGASAVAYTFPGSEGQLDYDYQEFAVSLNYADRVWLEYAYSPDIFHTDNETHNVSLFAEQLLPNEFVLSAGVGRYDVSALSGASYTYWELGVSRSFLERVEFDLRYHDANRWVPIFSSPDRVDARLVLSAKLSF